MSIDGSMEISPDNASWGCLFCSTGSEESVVRRLLRDDLICEAFSVRQLQHRSVNGQKSDIIKVMMPGYVFFLAQNETNVYALRRNDEVIRVLTYGDSWALRGGDLEFVEWIRAHQGLLGMSKVHREGEKVVIVSGPLKELEGIVSKVDRHNRNGQVLIRFGGKEIKVWLPFEYISEENA